MVCMWSLARPSITSFPKHSSIVFRPCAVSISINLYTPHPYPSIILQDVRPIAYPIPRFHAAIPISTTRTRSSQSWLGLSLRSHHVETPQKSPHLDNLRNYLKGGFRDPSLRESQSDNPCSYRVLFVTTVYIPVYPVDMPLSTPL